MLPIGLRLLRAAAPVAETRQYQWSELPSSIATARHPADLGSEATLAGFEIQRPVHSLPDFVHRHSISWLSVPVTELRHVPPAAERRRRGGGRSRQQRFWRHARRASRRPPEDYDSCKPRSRRFSGSLAELRKRVNHCCLQLRVSVLGILANVQ